MTWWSRLAALIVVVGTVLLPLRATAATVTVLVASVVAIEATATVRAGAHDKTIREYDGPTDLRVAASAGPACAYDGDFEYAEQPEARSDGAIAVASAAIELTSSPQIEVQTAAQPTLWSRTASFLRVLHADTRGGLRLPGTARTTNNPVEAFRRLQQYNGISPELASQRLHGIKQASGMGGADNVIFDLSGGVYHPETLEFLGTMTEGGAGGF